MELISHKCIECKNKFYCYDRLDTVTYIGCLCFKHKMKMKTSIFSGSEQCETIYCCSEECNIACTKELMKHNNKYYIQRIKDNYKNIFDMFVDFLLFVGIMIYFKFLIRILLSIFAIYV